MLKILLAQATKAYSVAANGDFLVGVIGDTTLAKD